MAGKSILAAALAAAALALGACVSGQNAVEEHVFDPAACYERDFPVYFDTIDTRLTPAAREVINAQADSLRGCRIDHVRIIGLAQDEGGREETDQISMQRADAIAAYLHRRTGWPRGEWELLATGERGAVTETGTTVPMRRLARITIQASAP